MALKKLAVVALMTALLAVRCSWAGAQLPVTLDYVMPTGVDPVDLTFNFIGDSHTITGNTLLSNGLGGQGGANLHAGTTFGPLSITEFTVTFDYAGGLSFLSSAPIGGFTPWSVPSGVVSPPGPAVFDAQPGSAPAGFAPDNNHYFALLRYDSDFNGNLSPSDIATFSASSITITATRGTLATPEPGILALAITPLAAGLLVLRRRRTRR